MSQPQVNPFVIGPDGYLLDRNHDGHPDDLAVRIVLPSDRSRISTDTWCALIDLAARLGLETTGLPDRLVLAPDEELPPDCRALSISSAGEIRALARVGLPTSGNILDADADCPPITDLAELFMPKGLLRDRDDDWLPDGTRFVIVLPNPCPPALGIAAVEFAARIGLESGGIDLPMAVIPGAALPPNSIAFDCTESEADEDHPATLNVTRDGLRLRGSDDERAALLRYLATTWPAISDSAGNGPETSQVVEIVRDLVTGASPLARASYLAECIESSGSGLPILLHADEPDEVRLARLVDQTVQPVPNWDEVFSLEWSDPWEVDRVRVLVRDELIPALESSKRHEPIDLLILVSEPLDIRQALQEEITTQIAELGTRGARIRVRSAYKAGLSWLREDVVPALQSVDGIDRIDFCYAPSPSSSDDESLRLDLPIRWLQELYPGDELLATALNLPLDAIDLIEQTPDDGSIYEVRAYRSGEVVWRDTFSPRWYELPYIALDPKRGSVLVSTGGIRATQGGETLFDRSVPTDCDSFWRWYQSVVLPEVGNHVETVTNGCPRIAQQPIFASLRVDAWVSEPNELLGIRQEIDSAAEALHEDVYFGSLDWLSAFGKALGGDELNGPGAILPFIHVTPGQAPRARVTLRARRRHLGETVLPDGSTTPVGPLDHLSPSDVRITGLTVDTSGLRSLAVTVSNQSDSINETTLRLLHHAANLTSASSTGRSTISVNVSVGDREPVALMLPLTGDSLSTVTPSTAAPSDQQILFGDDLPAYLARINTVPGLHAFQAARSFQGRPLWAIEIIAPPPTRRWSRIKLSLRKPTFLIVGRHHANEVASTTAAFRLVELLTTDPAWQPLRDAVNVVILPFANPDGAALHQELVAEHPTWKHHAARYNAVGMEYGMGVHDRQSPFGETRVRRELWERWLPDVIVDNHGVPSHEWSQHFAGFGSPPRFPVCYWMVQALIYGIIPSADTPDHQPFAETLRQRLGQAIAADPALAPANATYGHRYHRWGTSRVPHRFPAEIENDFLCYVTKTSPDAAARNFSVRYPETTTLDWITEVPDETAHDEHLALTAHAHLVANETTLKLMSEWTPPVEHVAFRGDGDTVSIRLSRPRPLVRA